MGGGEEIDIATKLGFSILLTVFAIGVFLQTKIIKAVNQDRTTAWEIQLSHSIVMLLHFSFVIIFEIAIYSIRSLDTYLRNWVCSATFFLRIVGTTEIICHSLMISFYKYIFIVHHNMAVKIGIDRMKKILCFVYLLFVVGNSLGYIFRPNTHAFNSVHNCGAQQVEKKVDLSQQLFMCGHSVCVDMVIYHGFATALRQLGSGPLQTSIFLEDGGHHQTQAGPKATHVCA